MNSLQYYSFFLLDPITRRRCTEGLVEQAETELQLAVLEYVFRSHDDAYAEEPGLTYAIKITFDEVEEGVYLPALEMATGISITNGSRVVGPHPSHVKVAQPYMLEQEIRNLLAATRVTEAKEDGMRLQGVTYIETVRKALMLPVRTFNTAVIYYHKFRLTRADTEYNFIDAATAALFFACKVEDTLKRSKEILCAAHNIRANEKLNTDDPIFEAPSKTIIGLERLVIEAAAFDFRSRHPQKFVIKFTKNNGLENEPFGRTAYDMCIDLYRTFAPLKQTANAMALACIALTAKLLGTEVPFLDDGKTFEASDIAPEEIMETVLDLLDLYTHHRVSTTVGQDHPIDTFINVRIQFNQKASAMGLARYTGWLEKARNGHTNGKKEATNGIKSPASPREPQPGVKDGTVRFMLDPQRARDEQKTVDRFFKMEEVEEVEYKR